MIFYIYMLVQLLILFNTTNLINYMLFFMSNKVKIDSYKFELYVP
jgi:hypothetical protein